ncbi:MAG: calcium/proton exchanger [Gemmatimonadota bacterium]
MSAPDVASAVQRALDAAEAEARRLGSDAIGAEHILLGLLPHERTVALLAALGIAPELAAARLAAGTRKARIRAKPDGERALDADTTEILPSELAQTSHARRIVELAAREAQKRNAPLSVEHLLLAAFHEPRGALAKLLAEAGVAPAQARTELLAALGESVPAPQPQLPARDRGGRPDSDVAETPVAAPRSSTRPEPRGRERPAKPPRPPRTDPGDERPVMPAARPAAERSPARNPTESPRSHEPRVLAHLRPQTSAWGPLWRRALLLAIPAALAAEYLLHLTPAAVFTLACLGVLPLAGYMGDATEHLSARTGPTIGGLLNATFGNAAELIIAIVALQAGYVELVKASITGSIIGNLLLILGLSLLAGGLKKSELRFNRTTAGMSATMLAAAVVGLVFPALFHATHSGPLRVTELRLSEGVAAVLIVTYAFSLLFSLKTHKWVVASEPHALDGPTWSVGRAVLVLTVATIGVAVLSEVLVGATRGVIATLPITETFLGLIIIPFIGNAAEHATAIMVARKGQIDLALQIALGSSTQIALLVAPMLVFVGVLMGRNMNLVFSPFEVMAVGLATLVTAISTLDGESHWFEGVQLLAVYAMIAVSAFFI